jgi:hypothetical protein
MEAVKMHYAKALIPMTLLAAAATVAGVACTTQSDDKEQTQSTAAEAKQDKGAIGKNGVLKIQDLVGNKEPQPDNDPHVGCRFRIEFRGFDKADELVAAWQLLGHPPSVKGGKEDVIVTSGEQFVGQDDASQGANDIDAFVDINLSQFDLDALGFEENKKGEVHLRVEADLPGFKGNGLKTKTFWAMSTCAETPDGGGSSSSSGGSSSGGSSSGGSSSGGSSSGKAW